MLPACRTALAPHIYGPSVTGANVTATFGAPLWERLTKSWGSKTGCSSCTTANAGTNQFYPGVSYGRLYRFCPSAPSSTTAD
jgi:hypothetical protein